MKHLAILVAVVAIAAFAFDAFAGPKTRSPGEVVSRLLTMYKEDPLTHSISLKTGLPGSVMKKEGIFNIQSDLDFGHYTKDGFSVGIEGGREGVIIDLGSQAELAKRYGYAETVGGGQGFASIQIHDGQIKIRKRRSRDLQPMSEAGDLFAKSSNKNDSAQAVGGHIYLVRIVDRNEPNFERIAKLIVVSHVPEVSATIRWVLMLTTGGP